MLKVGGVSCLPDGTCYHEPNRDHHPNYHNRSNHSRLSNIQEPIKTVAELLSSEEFFDQLTEEETPLLHKMYRQISFGMCRLDGPRSVSTFGWLLGRGGSATDDAANQKRLFLTWLSELSKIKDPAQIKLATGSMKGALVMGVRMLRTLLASTRIEQSQTSIGLLKDWPAKRAESQDKLKVLLAWQFETFGPKDIASLPDGIKARFEQLKGIVKVENGELSDKEIDYIAFNRYLNELEVAIRAIPADPRKDDPTVRSEAYKQFFGQDAEATEDYLKARKKTSEESQVANRSDSEARFEAFQSSTKEDKTNLGKDILTVFLKHTGETTESDRDALDSVTATNIEINSFTETFVDWWKSNHNGKVPDFFNERDLWYEMRATFIACLYGDIYFYEKYPKDVAGDVENWWQDPKLADGSVVITLANVVKKMGDWATESDMFTLASIYDAGLSIAGRDIGEQLQRERQIAVVNVGRAHWCTLYSKDERQELRIENERLEQSTEAAKQEAEQIRLSEKLAKELEQEEQRKIKIVKDASGMQAAELPFDEAVEFPGVAVAMHHALLEHLGDLSELEEIEENPAKQQVVKDLLKMLTECSVDDHAILVVVLIQCKSYFDKNRSVLEKGMQPKSLLGKMLRSIDNFFRKMLKIEVPHEAYKKALKDVEGVDVESAVKEFTSPKTKPF